MKLLDHLPRGLIVSCQAPVGSPLRRPDIMAAMAEAAQYAGAVAIRAQGTEDVRAIKRVCTLPVIGILKRHAVGSDVFITPNLSDAQEMVGVGSDIVAVDMTGRPRPEGEHVERIVDFLDDAGVPLMADIENFEQAIVAKAQGADILATTLAAHLADDEGASAPNLELLERIIHSAEGTPVIGEGGYSHPRYVTEAFRRGAHGVVVGRAITDTRALAQDFVEATGLRRSRDSR